LIEDAVAAIINIDRKTRESIDFDKIEKLIEDARNEE